MYETLMLGKRTDTEMHVGTRPRCTKEIVSTWAVTALNSLTIKGSGTTFKLPTRGNRQRQGSIWSRKKEGTAFLGCPDKFVVQFERQNIEGKTSAKKI